MSSEGCGRTGQPWTSSPEGMGSSMRDALALRLNEAIRMVFTGAQARWAPDTGDGLWVEARADGLYLCDHNTASRLSEEEATVEYIEQAAREWIAATGARVEHACEICSAAGQITPAKEVDGRWLCESCAAMVRAGA